MWKSILKDEQSSRYLGCGRGPNQSRIINTSKLTTNEKAFKLETGFIQLNYYSFAEMAVCQIP